MSARSRRGKFDHIAGSVATVGGALGVLAGLTDLAVGASIRGWVGNKLDTTRLGIATIALSAIALAAAIAWQRIDERGGGRRLATLLAFVFPAGICFTTIGRLWYLPGVLLLAAAVLVVAGSSRGDLTRAVDGRRWLAALTVTLGGYYIFLGADGRAPTGLLGILGGLLIWASLPAAHNSRRLALGLLALGTLPFALATWWSVVTPLIALLVLVIGPAAMRPNDTGRRLKQRSGIGHDATAGA